MRPDRGKEVCRVATTRRRSALLTQRCTLPRTMHVLCRDLSLAPPARQSVNCGVCPVLCLHVAHVHAGLGVSHLVSRTLVSAYADEVVR